MKFVCCMCGESVKKEKVILELDRIGIVGGLNFYCRECWDKRKKLSRKEVDTIIRETFFQKRKKKWWEKKKEGKRKWIKKKSILEFLELEEKK